MGETRMTTTLETLPQERRALGRNHRPWASLMDLVETRDDIQKTRIAIGNRLVQHEDQVIRRVHTAMDEKTGLEHELDQAIMEEVKAHPLWEWVSRITGIGPLLTAQLIHHTIGQVHTAECLKKREEYFAKKKAGEAKRKRRFECGCPWFEIERFDQFSKYNKYAGLVPGQRRRKGERFEANPKLKSLLLGRIVPQFIMTASSPYRALYDEIRAEEAGEHGYRIVQVVRKDKQTGKETVGWSAKPLEGVKPDISAKFLENRVRKRVGRIFLGHVYHVWHLARGVTPTKPYPISIMGHARYIPPPECPYPDRGPAPSQPWFRGTEQPERP